MNDPIDTYESSKEYTKDIITTIEQPVRIALDVEAVIVDTHRYFIETYNSLYDTEYKPTDIDNWDWVRNEVDWEVFDGLMHGGWKNEPLKMQPKENGVVDAINRLIECDKVIVNIVTGRTGVEDEMKKWLSEHDITEFNDFISTTNSKGELRYDVYIDDSPRLQNSLSLSQIQLFVRDSHNQFANTRINVLECSGPIDAISTLLEWTKC